MRDSLDTQVTGQLDFSDMYEPHDKLFAVSRIFARARKYMSLSEQKTFVYALSQIKYKKPFPNKENIVYLDKQTLADIIGIKSDADHLSVDLYRSIGNLPANSFIKVADKDAGIYDSGTIVTRVTMLKNRVRIKFEEEALSLFSNLSKDYITMWSSDIFAMESKRSVQFYEYLRQYTDTRRDVNNISLGIKSFKEMFSIPKDGAGSYMRKDGHLDRPAFEKYVIQPLCEDLKKCKMINLVMQPDGKYYVKEKNGKLVDGYRFFWTFSKSPAVATASEVKLLQDHVDSHPEVLETAKEIIKKSKAKSKPEPKERVDDNPEVLKVTKDMVIKAKPKLEGKGKKNKFINLEQREIDYDKIVMERLNNRFSKQEEGNNE